MHQKKVSRVGMKRRTKMIIMFQNHETPHATTKTSELNDDMKKALNTLTGGMGDVIEAYEPDF